MRCTILAAFVLLSTAAPASAQGPYVGETLISPLYSSDTYLIDMDLNVIKTWHCSSEPGFIAYLLMETVWEYDLHSPLARAPRYNMGASSVDHATPTQQSGRLLRNHPNPFSLLTRIPFQLHQPGRVQLEVFDLGGRRIVTLIDAPLAAGHHGVEWNGRDESGGDMASGIYLVRLRINETIEAERLVMQR
jgi:hypothetical protein